VPEIDHAAFLAPLRQRWLSRYDVTHIESRMFGTRLVYALGEAGVPIAELHADVDKLTRALPYAGLVRQHRVWLPRGAPWLDEWIDEHADFPRASPRRPGRHRLLRRTGRPRLLGARLRRRRRHLRRRPRLRARQHRPRI
jgi:hypothetical protein